LFIETEMVSEFVEHCDPDLLFELAARTAHPFERTRKNDDSVRSHKRVGGSAIGARDSLVESKQLTAVVNVGIVEMIGEWLVFYNDRHVIEQLPNVFWKFANDPGYECMKSLLTRLAGDVPSRANHA
jgi:hypothetical protein